MINIKRDAKKIFRQLRKLKQLESVTHKQVNGEPIYDVTSGDELTQYAEQKKIDAYITGYNTIELSDQIHITDSRCVMLKEELKRLPAIDDIIIFATRSYNVISTLTDPGDIAIELQLRSSP